MLLDLKTCRTCEIKRAHTFRFQEKYDSALRKRLVTSNGLSSVLRSASNNYLATFGGGGGPFCPNYWRDHVNNVSSGRPPTSSLFNCLHSIMIGTKGKLYIGHCNLWTTLVNVTGKVTFRWLAHLGERHRKVTFRWFTSIPWTVVLFFLNHISCQDFNLLTL